MLAAGLDSGALTVDMRLRDALSHIRTEEYADGAADARLFLLPADGVALTFPRLSLDDERSYMSELSALTHRSLRRLQRRLDDVCARVAVNG